MVPPEVSLLPAVPVVLASLVPSVALGSLAESALLASVVPPAVFDGAALCVVASLWVLLASCAAIAAPSGEMVTAESWLGLAALEPTDVVVASLVADTGGEFDAVLPLAPVCVSVDDAAALLTCMAILSHPCIHLGRSGLARPEAHSALPRAAGDETPSPRRPAGTQCDVALPDFSTAQKLIFRVGKAM